MKKIYRLLIVVGIAVIICVFLFFIEVNKVMKGGTVKVQPLHAATIQNK